jgi:hypothetical protein
MAVKPAKSKSQIEKFREAARKYGAGDDYDDALDKVAKARKLTDDEIKELAKQRRQKKR